MSSLNLATLGLLDLPTPLSIATEGLIQAEVIGDVVVVVTPEARRQGSPGGPGGGFNVGVIPSYAKRYRIPDRDDSDRTIHQDDEEVLELLIEILLTGGF